MCLYTWLVLAVLCRKVDLALCWYTDKANISGRYE